MHSKRTVIAVLIAAFLVAAPSADAAWMLSKPRAAMHAAQVARALYWDTRVVASCRPQFAVGDDPAALSHRWVCGWAGYAVFTDGTRALCSGQMIIAGSRHYAFQYLILRGERCEDPGNDRATAALGEIVKPDPAP